MLRGVAQNPRRQVSRAAEGVDELARERIDRHRVDREVPPRGVFREYGFSRNKLPEHAMRGEVERITREPVTEAELQMAKDIVLNELVFNLSSKRDVLQRRAFYEYHGYPEDFLERYQQKVRTLTAADLLGAAQRHIHPAGLAVVVVGMKEDFAQPLETVGPVAELDIKIPDPPSRREIPEATSESLDQGQALMRAAAPSNCWHWRVESL